MEMIIISEKKNIECLFFYFLPSSLSRKLLNAHFGSPPLLTLPDNIKYPSLVSYPTLEEDTKCTSLMPCLFYPHLESVFTVGVGINLRLSYSFPFKEALVYICFACGRSAFIILEYSELD
jgi:hypothetical protein